MEKEIVGHEIKFLGDILKNHLEQNNRLDAKASALLAISGGLFILAISIVSNSSGVEGLGILIMIVASAISSMLSVLTIKLPKKDRPHTPHLMYYKGFENLSVEEYKKRLLYTLNSKEKIVDEYAKEIYGIVEQGLRAKYKLIKLASFVLCGGFFISTLLILLRMII
jgi:hypothetical protein